MQLWKFTGVYGIDVIEDCAESLGAKYSGKLTGTFGTTSAFSFFANKTITTGEGGMILTNDDAVKELDCFVITVCVKIDVIGMKSPALTSV